MNDRFFKDTITLLLFNKSTQSFDRFVIKNVYFRHSIATMMSGDELIRVSGGSITIPSDYAQIGNLNLEEFITGNTWSLKKKSYVIAGEASDLSYNELVKKYHLFRITSVADNRKGGLQHLKIEVDE